MIVVQSSALFFNDLTDIFLLNVTTGAVESLLGVRVEYKALRDAVAVVAAVAIGALPHGSVLVVLYGIQEVLANDLGTRHLADIFIGILVTGILVDAELLHPPLTARIVRVRALVTLGASTTHEVLADDLLHLLGGGLVGRLLDLRRHASQDRFHVQLMLLLLLLPLLLGLASLLLLILVSGSSSKLGTGFD